MSDMNASLVENSVIIFNHRRSLFSVFYKCEGIIMCALNEHSMLLIKN